jgi:hypothetical protein
MSYWSLWNGHAPMAKCEAPDKAVAIINFRHHGYGGASEGSVDRTSKAEYDRLRVRTLPAVGERQPEKEKEEEW